MSFTHPFSGLVIIDFTHVLAGPACSYYLGLLGAKVIKVESPVKGDAIRHRGGTDSKASQLAMSTSYLTQAAGKESIGLDLDKSEDLKIFHRLLAQADVLVENHRPKTLHKLGIDEKNLQRLHPHLVHCAMTGYGRGGPQADAAAYDVNIQAACGLMDATGTSESGPMRTGAPILDYSTAFAAAFAISAALFRRQKDGLGSFIDVSMLETGLCLMSSSITDYLKTGNVPQRRGNAANSRSPTAGSFACKSGIISLGINEDSHFTNFAQALERPDWLRDLRFSDLKARTIYAHELLAEIEIELHKKSAEEWELILQMHGVPAARLRSLQETLDSEQVQKREFVQTLKNGLSVPTLPFRFKGLPAYKSQRSPPKINANKEEILDWLEEIEN